MITSTDRIFLQPVVLVRVQLAKAFKHVVSRLAQQEFPVTGDFDAGYEMLKLWVPNFAFVRGNLRAGGEHKIAACDDPELACLLVVDDVGFQSEMPQCRIAAH